jgi:kynureninase
MIRRPWFVITVPRRDDAHQSNEVGSTISSRSVDFSCWSSHRVEALLAGTPYESAKAYILQDYETVPFHYARAQ